MKEYRDTFSDFKSALFHLNENENGTIQISNDTDGKAYYTWKGVYSDDYKLRAVRTYLSQGSSIALDNLRNKNLNIEAERVLSIQLGHTGNLQYCSPYNSMNDSIASISNVIERINELALFGFCDWRIPTIAEIKCVASSEIKFPLWYSEDLQVDKARSKEKYSRYQGQSYIPFEDKIREVVFTDSSRLNGAELFEGGGFNCSPRLIVVRTHIPHITPTSLKGYREWLYSWRNSLSETEINDLAKD